MTLVTREELSALAERGGPGRNDESLGRALNSAIEEYTARRRAPIARYSVEVDQHPFPTLVAALLSNTPFESVHLKFEPVKGTLTAWDYSDVYREATLLGDGSAELVRDAEPPRESRVRGMARIVMRERFVPPVPDAGGTIPRPPADLLTVSEFARALRSTGIVPFSVATLLYRTDRRSRYEVDLLDNLLLPDIRAGRLPASTWVRRTPRISHAVDRLVARGELPGPTARALEVLAESNGLTPLELSQVLGGVRELGSSALKVLQARGLATLDRRTGVYRIRLEAFESEAESRGPPAPPTPYANPALRTSVMELMAAAEARATCPLCGDPLPPKFVGLLCRKCAELVAAGASA